MTLYWLSWVHDNERFVPRSDHREQTETAIDNNDSIDIYRVSQKSLHEHSITFERVVIFKFCKFPVTEKGTWLIDWFEADLMPGNEFFFFFLKITFFISRKLKLKCIMTYLFCFQYLKEQFYYQKWNIIDWHIDAFKTISTYTLCYNLSFKLRSLQVSYTM